ncbi:hypothetical protein [Nocardia sp. NPDC047654]|uniref:hypothetical protein n=1 Tax=Nocardia sp. NPDC047654 TaxID=3364314 RepID=UPI003715864B
MTIECKSSRDKPWVLFTDDTSSPSLFSMRWQRLGVPNQAWLWKAVRKANSRKLPTPLLDGYGPFGYALARTFASKNEDVAFSAMMSVAKAAAGLREQLAAAHKDFGSDDAMHAVVLPVLVVDAPLLKCELDDDGTERLSRIDRGTVLWKYQLTPGHPPSTIVTIVTPAALPSLADDLNKTADSLYASAIGKKPA